MQQMKDQREWLRRPHKVKVVRLEREARLPQRMTRGSAGWDLHAVEDVELGPGEVKAVGTGLLVELPVGTYGVVVPRSGLSLEGLLVVEGTLDQDYRGEVKVIMMNLSREKKLIRKGQRIAQLRIHPYVKVWWEEVEDESELSETERGNKGFGSTGK